MPDLFKQFEIPDEIEDVAADVTYPRSFRFDFTTGEFVINAGKVAIADGYHAWVQWCVKTVLTERYAHTIYSDDHGVEMTEVRELVDPLEQEDHLEATIRQALLEDPRTGNVSEFEFTRAGDELRVTFVLDPTIGPASPVDIAITI